MTVPRVGQDIEAQVLERQPTQGAGDGAIEAINDVERGRRAALSSIRRVFFEPNLQD